MNDLEKAIEIYNKRVQENPKYPQEVIDEWRDDMPEQFRDYIFKTEYGCHITSKDFYNEAVDLLEWANGKGKGAKWSVEDIKSVSGIDFDNKDYYELDFAYVMNMLWSDYCNIFTDTGYYIKMAQNYLEDADYMGDASERAYKNAKKRIKYFTEKE